MHHPYTLAIDQTSATLTRSRHLHLPDPHISLAVAPDPRAIAPHAFALSADPARPVAFLHYRFARLIPARAPTWKPRPAPTPLVVPVEAYHFIHSSHLGPLQSTARQPRHRAPIALAALLCTTSSDIEHIAVLIRQHADDPSDFLHPRPIPLHHTEVANWLTSAPAPDTINALLTRFRQTDLKLHQRRYHCPPSHAILTASP